MRLQRITKLFGFVLNLLLPQTALVAEIENMDSASFVSRVARSQGRVGKEIISLFDYRDALARRAIWELKYRGNKKVAALFAGLLYGELLAFLEEYALLTNFIEPLVIPIPLSRKRKQERGFNQSELLIDELEKLGGARNFTVSKTALVKIKDTQSQTKTEKREERLKNLEGCFAVKNPEQIRRRNIILIDDVATTGATLEEARKTLLNAGARKVIAFTIAH